VHILSADTQGGFTQVLSGTSMAAAQISGVAALAQSLALERLRRRLSPGEFMQLLEQTADLIQDQEVTARDGSAVDNTGLSFPRVNVQALAQAIVQLSETLLSPATSLSPLVATSSGETVARVGISASETTQSRPDASMDAISAAADYANLRGVDDWIIGTPQAERLWGDSGDDRLQGAGGHDSMAGGSGDDWLQPALTGSHWLDGGPGHDVVSYANPRSFYRISSIGRLTLVRNHQGDEDLLLDIEQLQFADQAIATTAFHTERTTDLTELGADSSELGADWPEPGIDSLGPRLRELAALADAQPERPGVIALAAFHAEAFELMAAGAANDPAQPLLDPARVFMTRTYQERGESVVDVRLAPGMRPILEGRFMASFNPAQAELDEGAVTAPSGWIVQAVNRVDDQGKTLGEVVITVRRDPSSPPPAMGAEPQTVFSLPFTPQWEGLRLGRIDDVRVDVGTFTDAAGFNYAPAFGANRLAQLVSADLPVSGLAGVSGSVSVLGMARQDTPLQIHEDLVDTTDNTPLSGRGLRIQWFELRSGIPTPIPGATETVFIPSQTLVGSALGVRLQFGSGNAAQVAYSPFTEPVANHNDAPLGALQLSGAARLGERLSVLNTVTDADGIPESGPDAPRVLWFADGNPIQGAGGDSLLLTQTLLGRRIHARLLYTDRFGAVEQLDSDQTSAVAALAMVDPEVSRTVPSLSGVPGDGNGDGIPDIQQITVISAPVSLLGPVNSRAFVTLVGDSIAGKPADNTGTQITALAQDIGNVSAKPVAMDTPLGHIQFTVELDSPGNTVPFSLYVQGAQINGYWKQDASGTWVNLASPPFGGLTTSEGSKIRLDFKIRDGDWPFDADGQVNGVITDPGVPALMAQSVALHLPAPVSGGLWF
jgi:hypothetical protein